MERENCSICNFLLNNIYNLDNVPTKLSCTSNYIQDFNKLSFSQCNNCNTIQLDKLIPLDILYSDSHNYTSCGKVWENYFKLFISKIKDTVKDKNILEIGCPSGKLANNLTSYNKWFIIEPNKNFDVKFNENVIFIEKFFDSNFTMDTNIDVIIHSHLFEHIYLPNDFLKKCNDTLKDDGEMIFGVPNMSYFAESNITPFLGVFFEHTIFLNKENISYMLNNNNFEIVEIIDYENHSTIYHCKKSKKINSTLNSISVKFKNFYNSFMESNYIFTEFVKKCNNIISNNSDKDVYIFGASYNTQYLLALGIDSNNIKGILDNSKEKQNKYFYGYDLIIQNPEIITNNDCIVILKNGYYANEIKEQLLSINKNINIIV
jgi:predicted SAM-dependent methyltransferase